MTAVPRPKLTPAEYLAIERAAEFRSEFRRGEIVPVKPATFAQNQIKGNLTVGLNEQLWGSPYSTLTHATRTKVPAVGLGWYTYPAIVIVHGPPEFEDAERDTVLNPRLIVEVSADPIKDCDIWTKAHFYRRVETVQELVLVSHDQPLVERHVRQAAGTWLLTFMEGLDNRLELATMPASVRLASIYAGVTFPNSPK